MIDVIEELEKCLQSEKAQDLLQIHKYFLSIRALTAEQETKAFNHIIRTELKARANHSSEEK